MIGTLARPNGRGLQDAHGKFRATYLCDWCGIEKVPHSGRAARVCIDCRHYETFAANGGINGQGGTS